MNTLTKIVAGFVGVVAVFGAIRGCLAPHLDRQTYRATVTDKQVKRHGESDIFLIFTELEDGSTRVFQDTDSLIESKFNSSDVYGRVKEGKTYKFSTYGWRVPFFSWYENIVGVEEVKEVQR